MKMKGLKDWGYKAGDRSSILGSEFNIGKKKGVGFSSSPPPMMFILALAFLGMILGGSTVAIFTASSMSKKSGQEEPRVETVVVHQSEAIEKIDVLVPVRHIRQNEVLRPALFSTVRMPLSGVPGKVVKTMSEIEGKIASYPLAANFPVSPDFLSADNTINEVVANIPSGYRAVAINVNATSSVEGWARAGAAVDVQWIVIANNERVAKLLVENARILSAERQVDSQQNPNSPIPTTVTLLVTNADAQKISLASAGGQLVLHLRGKDDAGHGGGAVSTLSTRDLLGQREPSSDSKIQGYVRSRARDGSMEEWALIDGKLVGRDEPLIRGAAGFN